MKSFEKADTRRILNWPVPITFPLTFQLEEVSPAGTVGVVVVKETTVESKTKSPWNPTRFWAALIWVVLTGLRRIVVLGTEVSMVSIGRDTVIPGTPSGTAGAAGAGSGGQNPGCDSAAWGAALKLDANMIAETSSKATEMVI